MSFRLRMGLAAAAFLRAVVIYFGIYTQTEIEEMVNLSSETIEDWVDPL